MPNLTYSLSTFMSLILCHLDPGIKFEEPNLDTMPESMVLIVSKAHKDRAYKKEKTSNWSGVYSLITPIQ